ncbi:MAG TPA: aminotransferase class V-fold PLP-dependent enzyme [Gammaproteobacteria bacterium]|nr:aminotransferase class V-fold PLP-dependent enzyme [Gammaproteobacteria bacterium]
MPKTPSVNNEFPLDNNLIYLNHAAVSPWPQRTGIAVRHFADENVHQGAYHYPEWWAQENHLREQLAQLIHAQSADDIALLKNTSEALSIVAHGLDWNSGDNVIISDEEFPSNRIVWESLQQQGVELRQISLASATSPEQALIEAMDKNTRLLSISSVQYASGLRVRLAALGEACSRRNVLFCVDAIQSVGALQTDVQEMQADFVMADGHKWMLGPEGLAFFYSRPAAREQLHLHQFGWHMVEDYLDFNNKDWQLARSARRFECGSPNMLGIHALSASLSLLLETGMHTVEQQLLDNSRHLFAKIRASKNLGILSDTAEGRFAGIVLFQHQHIPVAELYPRLMKKGIVCAARGQGLRFSPHFYTSKEQISEAINVADKLK